jgi:hypothetical protein
MGERVRSFRLGVAVEPGDPQACARALADLLNPEFLAALQPEYQRYAELHSEPRLRACLADLVAGFRSQAPQLAVRQAR